MPSEVKPHEAAVGKIASGCFIVTAGKAQGATGILASWVQQVSFEPLGVMVCIRKGRPIYDVIESEKSFNLSIVRKGDSATMKHFSKGVAEGEDPFTGIETGTGENGVPFLANALGHMECRVIGTACPGDHHVVFGEVVAGSIQEGEPLVHIRQSGTNY